MRKLLVLVVVLFFPTLAWSASPKLPATPFNFHEYKGPCRSGIVVTAGSPTVLITGTIGNSSTFTMATLSTGTVTAFFNGMADTMTASVTGGTADVTWCCSQEP